GEIVSSGETAPPTDRDRLNVMEDARQILAQQTGRDFGFDLAAWHHFLLNDDKLSQEYTFDYAWKAVRQRIDELLDGERVARQHFSGGLVYLCICFVYA